MTDDTTTEERLRAVEDRLAILDLEGAYGHAYDSKRGTDWAALFTEDGVYQGRRLAGMPAQNLVRGRENLARFCESEPLSGFEASGTDEHGRTLSRAVTGYYDIAYVRTAEGWRIRRRATTYLESAQRTVYRYEPTPFGLDEPVEQPDALQDARA